MARSSWKPTYIELNVLKKFLYVKKNNIKKPIKIWSRQSTILPLFVGYKFNVHNGKSFNTILIDKYKVGHKFGEFAPTKKRVVHKVKNKLKRK